MNNEKILTLNKARIVDLTWFVLLVGIATVAPIFHSQIITGSIVNATLFVATVILGFRSGIFVGFIPSAIAFLFGTLPAPLAPMIPYIILSNIILVLVFACFEKKNYILAVFMASFLKFIFLFMTSSLIINLFIKNELSQKIASMMSWPQLLTALLGGFLAYFFLKKKRKI